MLRPFRQGLTPYNYSSQHSHLGVASSFSLLCTFQCRPPLRGHPPFLLCPYRLRTRPLQTSLLPSYPGFWLDLPTGLCPINSLLLSPLKTKIRQPGSVTPLLLGAHSLPMKKLTTSICWRVFQTTLLLLERREVILPAVIGQNFPPKTQTTSTLCPFLVFRHPKACLRSLKQTIPSRVFQGR